MKELDERWIVIDLIVCIGCWGVGIHERGSFSKVFSRCLSCILTMVYGM